jgi:hypothetical protein
MEVEALVYDAVAIVIAAVARLGSGCAGVWDVGRLLDPSGFGQSRLPAGQAIAAVVSRHEADLCVGVKAERALPAAPEEHRRDRQDGRRPASQ